MAPVVDFSAFGQQKQGDGANQIFANGDKTVPIAQSEEMLARCKKREILPLRARPRRQRRRTLVLTLARESQHRRLTVAQQRLQLARAQRGGVFFLELKLV